MAAGIFSGVFDFLSQPQDQFEAARAGSVGWFKKQQNEGKNVDVNKKNQHEHTALYIAARNGHLPVVKFLVQHGADKNAVQKTKSTPLHAAAYYGHYQVVEYLVGCECNTTTKNSFGLTAAQEAKNAKIKKIILNKEAKRDDDERFTLKYMPTFNSNPIWMIKNSHWLFGGDGDNDGDSDSKENNEKYVINENIRLEIINNLKQSGYKEFVKDLTKLNKNWKNNYDTAGNIEKWNQTLIRQYTQDKPDGPFLYQLYKTLNKDIAKRNNETKLREYAIGLHHALESFPDFKGTCYRSIRLPDAANSVEKFQHAAKNGQFIQLPAFSSCSKSKKRALDWAGDGLLVIEVSDEPITVKFTFDDKNNTAKMIGLKDDEKGNIDLNDNDNQLQLPQPNLIKMTQEQLVVQSGPSGHVVAYQKEEIYVLQWSNNNNNIILGGGTPTYGKDISKFSKFPSEEEVLFTFENVFFCKNVTEIKKHKKKKWQIVLQLRPVTYTNATFDMN